MLGRCIFFKIGSRIGIQAKDVPVKLTNSIGTVTGCAGIVGCVFLLGCGAGKPQTRVLEQDSTNGIPPDSASWSPQAIPDYLPEHLSPPEWVGKTFVTLPKNEMFRKFGYELYETRDLGNAIAPADTSRFLSNGRLRADLFGGATMKVEEATAFGEDFLVRFRVQPESLQVFGRTKNGAIEGIAIQQDLAVARGRWTGDTVYSARRQIDVFDSTKHAFSSIPVSLTEPLYVSEIVWGQTPLPPKPIWVQVVRPNGDQGFIPIHFSWTNVIRNRRYEHGHPWQDDLLEENPKSTFNWDEYYWEAIDQHKVLSGMTPDQVRLSWGPPLTRTEHTMNDSTIVRQWEYDRGILRFVNDSLTAN